MGSWVSRLVALSLLVAQNQARGEIRWSDPVTVDGSFEVGPYASLALATNGSPSIAYYDASNGDLRFAWRGADKVWQSTLVDSVNDVGRYCSMALASDGTPRIAYYDATLMDLKYATWTGSSWVLQVVDATGDVGSHTAMALDSHDRPHIAYHDATNTLLKYAHHTGTSWSIREVDITGLISYLGQYNSVAIDPLDQPHISYCDYILGDAKHAWYNGYFWQYETVYSSGYLGYYTSITVDAAGGIHMCFCDPINGILYYGHKVALSWAVQPIDTGGLLSPSGYYGSIAVSSAGNPMIAYSYYDLLDPQVRIAQYDGSTWTLEDVFSSGYHYPTYTSLKLDKLGNPKIAYAEGLLGRRLDFVEGKIPPPNKGWAIIEADSPLTGMEIYGKYNPKGIAALPMSTNPLMTFVFPHFHCSSQWYTGIAMVNPNLTFSAHVLLTAFSNAGSVLAQQSLTLDPGQKVSYDIATLMGIQGTGWLWVVSDIGLMAQEVYGNLKYGGHGAVEPCSSGNFLYFPHFRTSTRWWTGIAIANPNAMDAVVVVNAYGDKGTLLGTTSLTVPAFGKISSYVSDLLGLTTSSGWIEVASFLPVVAFAIITDTQGTPMDFAALAPAELSQEISSPVFFVDSKWWSSISVVNPNSSANSVVMTAYRSNGVAAGVQSILLPALGKTSGMVQDLFPGISGTGWIRLKADANVGGVELLSLSDTATKGFAGVGFSAQSANTLYVPHYQEDSVWWTLFTFINPGGTALTARIYGYDSEGTWGNYAERNLSGHGAVAEYVDDLFLNK